MSERLLRILIVDDDVDILANLSDILSDLGYETVTACSGPKALEKLTAGVTGDDCPFDLCLLDFKLPGMDGVELLERIHVTHPTLPAIMITAYAGDDGDRRARDAGTLAVMRKPVDIQSLLGKIVAAIDS